MGYTKGPWRYEWRNGQYSEGTIYSGDGESVKMIAIVAGSNYGEWRDADDNGDSEFESNARVLSAAPDLLEALEGMLQIFGVTEANLTASSDVHAVEVECCNIARAAVRRAKGEAE